MDGSQPLPADIAVFFAHHKLGRRTPNPVALLKIDIEGAEVPILESLLDTGLIARIEYTFAETHEATVPELAGRVGGLRRRIARDGLHNINLDWI